jgi:hypothetical protein
MHCAIRGHCPFDIFVGNAIGCFDDVVSQVSHVDLRIVSAIDFGSPIHCMVLLSIMFGRI